MTFIARIVRYIFWVLVASWTVSLLRRIVSGMVPSGQKSEPFVDIRSDAVSRKLVRDPVCGMHLTEGLGIPLRDRGELIHFCSTECRDKYVGGTQKFAANG